MNIESKPRCSTLVSGQNGVQHEDYIKIKKGKDDSYNAVAIATPLR